MKKLLPLLMFLVLLSNILNAKLLVLGKENFNITMTVDTLIQYSTEGIANPEPGKNQLWNYLHFEKIGMFIDEIFSPDNPYFSEADYKWIDIFEVIAVQRGFFYDEYAQIDNDGYKNIGFSVKDQRYFIGDLTGNPSDSLIFPEQNFKYNPPRYFLKFPVTFGSAYSSKYTRILNSELSVGMLGMDHTPTQKVSHFNVYDTVIGCGTLILPDIEGKLRSNNVLLLKRILTRQDSILVNWQPAPQALLNAFGITQGAITNQYRYYFYRENRRLPLLNFIYSNEDMLVPDHIYYDSYIDPNTDINENELNTKICFYPNPVENILYVELSDELVENVSIQIQDLSGRVLSPQDYTICNNNNRIVIDLSLLSTGVYFINISTSTEMQVVKVMK